MDAVPRRRRRVDRDEHRSQRPRVLALGHQPQMPVFVGFDQSLEQRLVVGLAGQRPAFERMVERTHPALGIDQRRLDPGGAEGFAGGAADSRGRKLDRVVAPATSGKRHSSRSARAPMRSTSTALGPAAVTIPAAQPPPSRHAISRATASPLAESSSSASLPGATEPPNRWR